jgi:hypothetical protein
MAQWKIDADGERVRVSPPAAEEVPAPPAGDDTVTEQETDDGD